MQSFTEITDQNTLLESIGMLMNNDKTALSCSSGTAFPTANLEVGMFCYRTDESKLYQLKDATPTWKLIFDLSKTATNKEYVDAAVSGVDLSTRVAKTGDTMTGNLTVPALNLSADANNRFEQGKAVLRSASPTVYFRDTDHSSAMWHCNSGRMYLLRGAVDSETWTQANGSWPLEVNLDTNEALFGGKVRVQRNLGTTSDYAHSQLELRCTDGGDVSLGFHRLGYTACALRHENNGLRLSGVGEFATADFIVDNVMGVYSSGVDVFRVNYTRNGATPYFYVNTGGGYGTFSDARLKNSIEPLSPEAAVTLIRGVTPVEFNWNEDAGDDKRVGGFLAQDVLRHAVTDGQKNILTHWETYDESDPECPKMGLSDHRMIPSVVAALQHALARIDDLQTQIDALTKTS